MEIQEKEEFEQVNMFGIGTPNTGSVSYTHLFWGDSCAWEQFRRERQS